jgi:pimeloyl-ACP methyl ester carboxylesterase
MKLFRPLACFLLMTVASASAAETVVILHGLGRGFRSMSYLTSQLERAGYTVVNDGYPSRTMPIETIAAEWLPTMLRERGADKAERVHFVTHSMGGIVVRQWLAHAPAADRANLGRVVMIAPPNAGSEVSERLATFPPFRWFTGVNGHRLGTAATDLPRALGPWPAGAPPLGVIAGDRTLNPLFSAWLPGPDDGKVSVASTRLAGMTDAIVVHHSHTWLMWRADTAAQVIGFLREGRFQAIPPPPAH